jgi:hypothetical protein
MLPLASLFLPVLLLAGPASAAVGQSSAPQSSRLRFKTPGIDPDLVSDANLAEPLGDGSRGSATLRAQILLDRAHCSPGELNAAWSFRMRQAVEAFQGSHEVPVTGRVDAATWAALNQGDPAVLKAYTVAAGDTAAVLAERFHSAADLLSSLNPGRDWTRPGLVITVPAVRGTLNAAKTTPPEMAAQVVVSARAGLVRLFDARSRLLASYPASAGSRGVPGREAALRIARVRRQPRGIVSIALSNSACTIQGTSVPGDVPEMQLPGCITLTNWDAADLARLAPPGTPVLFR